MSDSVLRDPAGDVTDCPQGDPNSPGLTRREALKLSGLTLGGVALGGVIAGLAPASAVAENPCEPGDDCCADDPRCDGDCCDEPGLGCDWTSTARAQRYTYFERLSQFQPFVPATTRASTVQRLDPNSMRITLMGTAVPPRNLSQRMVSVFVEVGWDEAAGLPVDNFVFDCGTGSSGSYNSMNVGFGRMNKIFLTHLHADHMGDLAHIYCFGPSVDRWSPLWVWGGGDSGVQNPNWQATPGAPPQYYADGTAAFCAHLRDACRWHSESFSFQPTAYVNYPNAAPDSDDPRNFGFAADPNDTTRVQPPAGPAGQYGDDAPNDGYAIMPVEIPFAWGSDWTNSSPPPVICYDNQKTHARITAYPVIHTRQGAVGYKLEWTNPNGQTLRMIFTGDTKPERLTLEQAVDNGPGVPPGVDVLIHEMGLAPEVWAMKVGGYPPGQVPVAATCGAKKVQNSAHTPQGAFGYLLSELSPLPGLTVATHFPTADDTVACAMKSLQGHMPKAYQGERPNPPADAPRVTFAADLMVITVSVDPTTGKRRILEQRGVINPFGFQATAQRRQPAANQLVPKYHCADATDGNGGDPLAQINSSTTLWPCDDEGNCNYRADGY